MSICARVRVCVSVCVDACVYACVCVCVCMHTCTRLHATMQNVFMCACSCIDLFKLFLVSAYTNYNVSSFVSTQQLVNPHRVFPFPILSYF